MISQGILSMLKPSLPRRGLSSVGRVTQWLLIMSACGRTEKEKEFDHVMSLAEVQWVVAVEQMTPEDRVDLFLYEMRTGRPASLGIMADLVRSKPSIVPVLVARLKTDDADQLYPLLLLANYALCTDVLLSRQANTERGRTLREAVLIAVSRVPREGHLWALNAAGAARGECRPAP